VTPCVLPWPAWRSANRELEHRGGEFARRGPSNPCSGGSGVWPTTRRAATAGSSRPPEGSLGRMLTPRRPCSDVAPARLRGLAM
jgi:hypothetical protein